MLCSVRTALDLSTNPYHVSNGVIDSGTDTIGLWERASIVGRRYVWATSPGASDDNPAAYPVS